MKQNPGTIFTTSFGIRSSRSANIIINDLITAQTNDFEYVINPSSNSVKTRFREEKIIYDDYQQNISVEVDVSFLPVESNKLYEINVELSGIRCYK
ncbi:hypothetical protein SS50377_20705 [Spironucleus salmonicida]|uniref:Uncharacterized protein n=1 Tax=Spironucleus salmonicida TaxID=348837 RepID=A0A9P8LZL8_9EUKA|nr:hypothetical protein SS50377_20705 [Spironucleus salmonicida]